VAVFPCVRSLAPPAQLFPPFLCVTVFSRSKRSPGSLVPQSRFCRARRIPSPPWEASFSKTFSFSRILSAFLPSRCAMSSAPFPPLQGFHLDSFLFYAGMTFPLTPQIPRWQEVPSFGGNSPADLCRRSSIPPPFTPRTTLLPSLVLFRVQSLFFPPLSSFSLVRLFLCLPPSFFRRADFLFYLLRLCTPTRLRYAGCRGPSFF